MTQGGNCMRNSRRMCLASCLYTEIRLNPHRGSSEGVPIHGSRGSCCTIVWYQWWSWWNSGWSWWSAVCPGPCFWGAAFDARSKVSRGNWSCNVKIPSSKRAVTSASGDRIGFRFFVWSFLWSAATVYRDSREQPYCVARGENIGSTQDGWQSQRACQECFPLICGGLGFCGPSHIIPMRFYLSNLPLFLLYSPYCSHYFVAERHSFLQQSFRRWLWIRTIWNSHSWAAVQGCWSQYFTYTRTKQRKNQWWGWECFCYTNGLPLGCN